MRTVGDEISEVRVFRGLSLAPNTMGSYRRAARGSRGGETWSTPIVR